MPEIPFDPFPTARLSVPNLSALLARLRDGSRKHCVTVVHARTDGEGEWILATAAARLKRGHLRVIGPDPTTADALVDHAIRVGAAIVLTGELRRDADALALRRGAAFGVRAVGIITCARPIEARMRFATLGPWNGYDAALLGNDV